MSVESMSRAFRSLQPGSELAQQAAQTAFFKRAQEQARRVQVGGKAYYLLEGDLLLDEMQLAEYALAHENPPTEASVAETDVGGQRARLLGIARNGKMVRWKPGMILSYFVSRETFPSQQQYQTAREAVRSATEDWMKVCGVQFEYRPQLDTDPSARTQGAALFPVMHFDAHGEFIAAAFFPDDPPDRRMVLIDPSFFSANGFDKVGVLRHELGHVLGFRHEHIRSGAPPGCPGEPLFGTIDLTQYDPRSVMHYFCGGVGSRELAITELDQQGAQRLYGLALSSFQFVE
jgi:hypothetical protein